MRQAQPLQLCILEVCYRWCTLFGRDYPLYRTRELGGNGDPARCYTIPDLSLDNMEYREGSLTP